MADVMANPMVAAFLHALAAQNAPAAPSTQVQSRSAAPLFPAPSAPVQPAVQVPGVQYRQAPVAGVATQQGDDGKFYAGDGWQQGSYGDKPGTWESFQGDDGKQYYRDWAHSGSGVYASQPNAALLADQPLKAPSGVADYERILAQMGGGAAQTQPMTSQPGQQPSQQAERAIPSSVLGGGAAQTQPIGGTDPGFLMGDLVRKLAVQRSQGQPAQVKQVGSSGY